MLPGKRKKLVGELSVAPGIFVKNDKGEAEFWLMQNLEISGKSAIIHVKQSKKGPFLTLELESFKKKWAIDEKDLK
ncbi:MAG: hypothetical protein MJ208_03620 [Bacilli bacterium]|nr:hypothetical protein [Bacilli bacterium]